MKPELLAPAGNLNTAVVAFQAGADAVYLGLKEFSARKSAPNFDWDDLRKLVTFARKNNKKIYVTLNTIIKENELSQITTNLALLEYLEIDAVIIQDIGLLNIIQKQFPSLQVHASTQMATNSSTALKLLKDNGINRVILPREMEINEIEQMHKNNPTIELEAFVHGALCYSYSGMCLASGLLLNRSGNRGECAQLCRNYYKTPKGDSYLFSCNDLFLSKQAKALINSGICSLKIEGRLKGIAYTHAVIKLYRYILDNKTVNPNIVEKLEHAVQITFSRKPTTGYLHPSSGEKLTNPNYPKNLGIPLGNIKLIKRNQLKINSNPNLASPGDKILILNDGIQHKGHTATIKHISGDTITFHTQNIIKTGSMAFLLQKKYPLSPIPKLTLWKKKVNINVTLVANKLILVANLLNTKIEQKYECEMYSKTGSSSFKDIFNNLFLQTGKSFHYGDLTNYSSDLDHIFIKPSHLKQIKNEFWKHVDHYFNQYVKDKSNNLTPYNYISKKNAVERASLLPKDNLPFAHLFHLEQIEHFKNLNNHIHIPLHPLITTDNYYKALNSLIEDNPHYHFSLGLNSTSHIAWLKNSDFENVSYWCDIYIYIANSQTLQWITLQLEKYSLDFAISWVESHDDDSPLTNITDKNSLPHMISRGCVHKENYIACHKCPKKIKIPLSNNNNHFELLTIDCISYLLCRTSR